MKQTGRPRVLADEQKRRTLLAMISIGAGLEEAARQVGCSTWTVHREAQRDEAFAEQLRQAETSAQLAPLQKLRTAASSHWRAAAWLLERINPERFAYRKPESVTVGDVRHLLDSVASLIAEECPDQEQQQRLIKRLGELQVEHFGESRATAQGLPEPLSDIERFIAQFDRGLGPSRLLPKAS